jgi:hypothetical protein
MEIAVNEAVAVRDRLLHKKSFPLATHNGCITKLCTNARRFWSPLLGRVFKPRATRASSSFVVTRNSLSAYLRSGSLWNVGPSGQNIHFSLALQLCLWLPSLKVSVTDFLEIECLKMRLLPSLCANSHFHIITIRTGYTNIALDMGQLCQHCAQLYFCVQSNPVITRPVYTTPRL